MKLRNFFAYDPRDDEETRLEKFSIFLVAVSCSLAGSLWTAMYYFIFGWGLTTALPLLFFLLVSGSLIVSHRTKNHLYAIYTQIICILYIPTFIQWSIGGVFDSGFVLAWAILGPIGALLFFVGRRSTIWFLLYLVNLLISVLFNDFFAQYGQPVSENIQLLFFTMNLGFSSLVVFIFAAYYVTSAREERKRANTLLLNVLPREIAAILKTDGQTIANHFDAASVLFADIVGSTQLFTELEPTAAVDWLNEIFSMFDRLVEHYGLEKIRTIGDNYMVASGVPSPRPDHAQALAHLALDMLQGLQDLPARNEKRLGFRIGLNSGPMVAGVIGKTKFHYDVWGDTVNTASRMESQGEIGKVQITRTAYELLKDDFICIPRGAQAIKGKGHLETWFLVDRINQDAG